jgi:hypothetical protein
MYQQPRYVVRPLAPRRGPSRPTRGSAGGAHHVFKGVRTRRGVKGYLVEIRPPKWKKTIWLGTYNTSIEAAGAYDAGTHVTATQLLQLSFRASLMVDMELYFVLFGVDFRSVLYQEVQHQVQLPVL